jgi:hypothetical protein
MSTDAGTLNLSREIRMLLQIALGMFIFTVVIGILNGTDLVDFEVKELLAHVHSGTLGWITLCAIAGGMWLFQGAAGPSWHAGLPRLIAYLAPVLIVIYVAAFWSTSGMFRPIMGTAVGVVLLLFLVWIVARARYVVLTVPHVGFLAAAATSVTGALFGILLGLQLATGDQFLPDEGEDAHPATMVIGFLIPVGMSLAELGLRGLRGLPRAGRLGTYQIGFPFVGGILVALGILLDATPLIGLSLPFEIAGIVILLTRLGPDLRKAVTGSSPTGRFAAFSVSFLLVNIIFFVYLVVKYEGDFDLVPENLLLGLDHMMFIGVITNAVLALIYLATRDRNSILPQADTIIVAAVNGGLIAFAVGLIAEVTALKQIGTPIMGGGILFAILVFTLRLRIWEPSAEMESAGST